MRIYGLKIDELEEAQSLLQQFFGMIDDCQVYLFGSRSTGKHKPFSDIDLFIKSKSPEVSKKIPLFLEAWEKSKIPYKVDLSEWSDLFKPYVPQIKKDKKLFWSSEQSKLPFRVCPYGEHWVIRHDRFKNGKLEDVDGHCRLDRGKKDVLYSDEIQFISKTQDFLKLKAKICSYNGKEIITNGDEYDQLIIGWCSYWNEIFKVKNPLEPNFIKALIFSESRFKAKTITKNNLKVGNAVGLIQITESTLKILRDRKGEIKDHYMVLKKVDLLDPSINICTGIRWMFHKREILKKRLSREPEWIEVIAEYKGLGSQLKNSGAKALKLMDDFKIALRDFKC